MAGLVPSSYFAGFTLAALRCGPIRAGWAHPRLRRLRWDGGHGDRDEAGRATPVDRRRNAALRRARAAPVAVVVGALSGLISRSSRSFLPGCSTTASRARRSQCPCWWRCLVARVAGSNRQLSDRFDRRIVLAALGLGFAGAAAALVLLNIMKRKWSNRDSASRAEPEVRIRLPPGESLRTIGSSAAEHGVFVAVPPSSPAHPLRGASAARCRGIPAATTSGLSIWPSSFPTLIARMPQ